MICDEKTLNAELDARAALAKDAFILIVDAGDNVLAKLKMRNPAFMPAKDGVLTANQIFDEISAPASGEADKFKITNDEGSFMWTGDIGDEIKLSPNNKIMKGATVSISCNPNAEIKTDYRLRPINKIPNVSGEISLNHSDHGIESSANIIPEKPSGTSIEQLIKGKPTSMPMKNYKANGGPRGVQVYAISGGKEYRCDVLSNVHSEIVFALNDRGAPDIINKPSFRIMPVLSRS